MFTFPPQFGRLDGSYGHVLINTGKGEFKYIENRVSGINIRGEIRDIKEVTLKGQKCFLITQNDNYPLLYTSGRGASQALERRRRSQSSALSANQ